VKELCINNLDKLHVKIDSKHFGGGYKILFYVILFLALLISNKIIKI
jgi:hypothetical protein